MATDKQITETVKEVYDRYPNTRLTEACVSSHTMIRLQAWGLVPFDKIGQVYEKIHEEVRRQQPKEHRIKRAQEQYKALCDELFEEYEVVLTQVCPELALLYKGGHLPMPELLRLAEVWLKTEEPKRV